MTALPAPTSVSVELSSLVNPIVEYGDAFAVAFQNAVALGDKIAANPAPILAQVIRNELAGAAGVGTFVSTFGNSVATALAETPEQVQAALDQLAEGNVSGALNTLVNTALAPVVQAVVDTLLFNPEIWSGLQNAIRQPIANALAVVDLLAVPQVYNLLGPLLAPVQVITDVTGAVGAAGDQVVAGLQQGDVEKVANAILSVGPDVTYAVLNGTPISGDYAAGLLGPNGVVAGLLNIRDQIATAITPPATANLLKVDDAGPVTAALEAAPEAKTPAAGTVDAPKVDPEPTAAESISATSTDTGDDSTAATAGTGLVKLSPKAVPGKTGTDASSADRPGTKLRENVRGAIRGLVTGLKDASDKLTGKAAKADTSGASAGSEKSSSSDKGSDSEV